MYKHSLAIIENTLGPEDPRVVTSLNNLAFLYQVQGRYEDAESPYEQALSIAMKVLGPGHPNTRNLVQNLSALLRAQGRGEEAERLAREYRQ